MVIEFTFLFFFFSSSPSFAATYGKRQWLCKGSYVCFKKLYYFRRTFNYYFSDSRKVPKIWAGQSLFK